MMKEEYRVYLERFSEEGIDVACKALNRQCDLTTEAQSKGMFKDWDATVGAAEMAAKAAIAAYKDILFRAFTELGSDDQ